MMSRKTILTFLRIILCWILWSQLEAIRISGLVCSENGEPLESVFISDARLLQVTDETGCFDIKTQADSLHFSRIGYERLSLPISEIPEKVILVSQEINLPVIRVSENYESAALTGVNSTFIYPDTNYGSSSAGDILLKLPTFGSTDTPLTGEYQSISILGGLSRHTLVMLDGMPLNSPGEAFDFSRIPTSQISHIEIIKGASSVYGGSSAISGIVNIVTKNPQTHLGAELEGGAGSFGLLSQRVMAYMAEDKFSVSAEYSHYNAKNDFAYVSSFSPFEIRYRENSRKTADYFFFKISHPLRKSNVQYILSYDRYERELPGPTSFPMLYDNARQTGKDGVVRRTRLFHRGKFNYESVIMADYKQKTYINLDSTSSFARAHESQALYSPLIMSRLSFKHSGASLSVAGEMKPILYTYKDHLQSSHSDNLFYINNALSASAQYESGRGIWQQRSALALRQDWVYSESHSSWRLEEQVTLYQPIEIALKANLGTAFSIPSLFDIAFIGDSQTEDDTTLKSESSFGYDFGIHMNHKALHLEAAYYYNKLKNLIQWRQYFLNGSTWRPVNVGEAVLKNYEFALQIFLLESLSLRGDLLLSEAKDFSKDEDGIPSATYDKYLPYSPKYRSGLSIAYEPQSFGASLSYNRMGEQYTTVDNLAGSIPAIDLLNLHGYYKKKFGDLTAKLDLELNNILDKKYEIYAHVPQPGFHFKVGLLLSYDWDI
nr:vitamin transporter [Candidatus Cloacimonadota bacterium]